MTDDEALHFEEKYGRTINIGTFESVRIDLSRKFYGAETTIENAFEKVRGKADSHVKKSSEGGAK